MGEDPPLFYALPGRMATDWCSVCGVAVPLPGLDTHRAYHQRLTDLAAAVAELRAALSGPETA